MVGSNRVPYPKCTCGHSSSKHTHMWDRDSRHKCRVNDCNCKVYTQIHKMENKE